MTRLPAYLALAGIVAVAACSNDQLQPQPAETAPELASARSQAPVYLVTFRDDVTDVESAARDMGRRYEAQLRHVRKFAARGFSAHIPEHKVAALRADPRVLIVEKDGPVSLVRPIEGQAKPGGGGGAEQTPWGITRVGGSVDFASSTKKAYIIDTGIDIDHPDLNVSTSCSANFQSGTSFDDGNGHGTHVAGTIGAKDNDIGVVGVAAGVTVCAVRVLNNAGSGSWESVINGINFVASRGVSGDVANMSLGGTGANATLEKAVTDASRSVKFAIAAGNDGELASNHTPARVNGSNIYTIAATGTNDCLTSWSNYGNPPVDYAAPGANIYSTYKGGGYRTLSGTSMATPHVAGILLVGGLRSDTNACGVPSGGGTHPIAEH
jgi:subtilisin family serine protease